MDREISAHLTDTQIEALDFLSMDCGLTNRELTRWMDKKESDEGNTRTKITKPLLESGIIYQVKRKYPNKFLFIIKSYKNIYKLKNELADPIFGKIQFYKKAHRIEQIEYEKKKYNYMREHEAPPEISDTHLEIRHILGKCIHLYKWCNEIEKDLHAQTSKRNTKANFSLLSLRPQCDLCKDILNI